MVKVKKTKKPPDPAEVLHEECLGFIQKRMFKEKRIRNDVKERKSSNKETTCTVVKTTWNSFCKPSAAVLDIAGCLFDVNKAVLEAYILANFHVMRLCSENLHLPELNQSFFYKCLSAVGQSSRPNLEVADLNFRQTIEKYRAWRPQGYKLANSSGLGSGWFQQASQQMATVSKNGTSMNFYRRFRNYLRCKYDLDGRQAYATLKAIQDDEYSGADPVVLRYRAKMPAKPRYGKREDVPEVVMPMQYMFLQHFEEVQRRCEENDEDKPKHCRLFSLLPTKQGFECSHAKLCTNGLQGLLKRSKVESVCGRKIPSNVKEFRELADDLLWRHFFNIEDFETVNRKFAAECLIDGKAVSIVLKKPKIVPSKTEKKINLDHYHEVWGLDPGRREVFVASNTDKEVQRMSTKHFYHDAKYKASNKKIQYWHDHNKAVSAAIKDMPTKKTADISSIRSYADYIFPRVDMLLTFHMAKGFRDLKFRRHVLKQKHLQMICKNLTQKHGKQTLIGFGDWSNKDSAGIIKKSPAGPVKQLERELKRHCKVVPVDEFRSSKLHESCHCELHKTYFKKTDKNGVLRSVKNYSVLFCSNRSCNGMRVNRDVNASRNILALLQDELRNGSRPQAFRRSTFVEFSATPTTSARADSGGLSRLVAQAACQKGRCRTRGNARQSAASLLR